MSDYEVRVVSKIVVPKGEPLFSEMATVVSIEDEAAGEFVTVTQHGRTDLGKIAIEVKEWNMLRDAIDSMILQCRESE